MSSQGREGGGDGGRGLVCVLVLVCVRVPAISYTINHPTVRAVCFFSRSCHVQHYCCAAGTSCKNRLAVCVFVCLIVCLFACSASGRAVYTLESYLVVPNPSLHAAVILRIFRKLSLRSCKNGVVCVIYSSHDKYDAAVIVIVSPENSL